MSLNFAVKDKKTNLEYIIEKELFIICPPLPTDQFVSYCKDHGVKTSRNQLEQFEKLGIFYPFLRIKYPKIKTKIKYIDSSNQYIDLGILEDEEKWDGDIKEGYSSFRFEKKFAENWMKEGLLWEPSTRPFNNWKTFVDENGDRKIESFYSIFQIHILYELIKTTTLEIRAEWWCSYSSNDIDKMVSDISEWSKKEISYYQKKSIRGEEAVIICQIISNRYFPKTQSDRRSFILSKNSFYHSWDWYKYCRNWDATLVLADIGSSIDELKQLYELVSWAVKFIDPLDNWYELICFVSVEKKKKLKGDAALAQVLYSMMEMLRLFYEDITGSKILLPWQLSARKNNFYGNSDRENDLQFLEFLTNQYHINPRPKLILVVEGNGEEEQFPLLAEKFFGYHFPKLGIEIMNIQGVGNFSGKKSLDRYGALEKFIDAYHYKQTIVFVVLDNEGRVPVIKKRLIEATSKSFPERKVTKEEYIHVWDKCIEFDNFSHEEIAIAMTQLCNGQYEFRTTEIEDCENHSKTPEGDHLSRLYNDKIDHGLQKLKLLKILFEFIVSNGKNEFHANGIAKRPVVQVTKKIIELALKNHQPTREDIWQKNQGSGYFGDVIKKK